MDSVPPQVYDAAIEESMFEFDNGKMKMNTNIDLNGYSINVPFLITGYYKKSKSSNRLFLNDVSTYQIIPYNCILNETVCYFYTPNNNDYRITLNVRSIGKNNISQTLNSSSNERRQVFVRGINLSKNDVIWIGINKMNVAGGIITHDEAVFSSTFTPR